MRPTIITLLDELVVHLADAKGSEAIVQLSQLDDLKLWLARTRRTLDGPESEPFAGSYIWPFDGDRWQAIDARTEADWLRWRKQREDATP